MPHIFCNDCKFTARHYSFEHPVESVKICVRSHADVLNACLILVGKEPSVKLLTMTPCFFYFRRIYFRRDWAWQWGRPRQRDMASATKVRTVLFIKKRQYSIFFICECCKPLAMFETRFIAFFEKSHVIFASLSHTNMKERFEISICMDQTALKPDGCFTLVISLNFGGIFEHRVQRFAKVFWKKQRRSHNWDHVGRLQNNIINCFLVSTIQ